MDSSDTGTGKTYTAIAVAQKVGARPAIVCPLAVVPSWTRICAEFGVEPVFVVNYEGARSKSFTGGGWATYDRNGRPSSFKWNPDGRVIFIWDEVQRCRAEQSQNTKMLMAAAARYKNILLSATPFTTPLEAFAIGRTLRLFSADRMKYLYWCFKHGCRKSYAGGMEFRGTAADMEAIHRQIFPSRGVRTRRSEIPGFPKTLIEACSVETGEANDIQRAFLAELELRRAGDLERMREKLPEELWEEMEPLQVTVDLRAR